MGGGLRRGAAGWLAGVVVMALMATSCSGSGSSSPTSSGPTSSSATSSSASVSASTQKPPPGSAPLASFYAQRLSWTSCTGGQCAKLTVPVDYSNPSGPTIQLSVLKVPAKGHRIGSLVVNPGGPGGSGVDYARAADQIVTTAVRAAYDVVGFDPRGVASSAPITCLTPSQMDTFLAADPTPDDPSEAAKAVANSKAFAAACKANGGPLLGHVSTIDAAKDMDVLRAALGEDKLTYLGKSYGTFLGATYADLFPRLVGRFVLDGVESPDETPEQANFGQAVGFETATRAYVAFCVKQGSCPLGTSVDAGMQRLRDFLHQVDAQPLPVTDDVRVKALTEAWASYGLAEPMYYPQLWPSLTLSLRQAFAGSGNDLMLLADEYAHRSGKTGDYSDNLLQVITAVDCLDRSDSSNVAHYEADVTKFSVKAPTWGPLLAWSSLNCGFWPYKANNKPKKITAAGSGPIVVIGTTRDPATPYESSVRLAQQLTNGHLISWDGDGHTAYDRSNACVDDAVDAYLLSGTVPPTNLRC